MKYSITELKNITDNIGWSFKKIKELVGDPDTSDTLKYAAKLNLNRVIDTSDEERLQYVHDAFKNLKDALNPFAMAVEFYRPCILALHTNLKQSVSDFFYEKKKDNDPNFVRICPEYALLSNACGFPVNPKLVFPPITPLARWTEGVGFVKLEKVDTTLYGGGALQAVIENGSWNYIPIVATGYDEEGQKQDWTGTLSGGPGDTIDLTNPNNALAVEIISITVGTGAPTGGQFRIETKLDRTITP